MWVRIRKKPKSRSCILRQPLFDETFAVFQKVWYTNQYVYSYTPEKYRENYDLEVCSC